MRIKAYLIILIMAACTDITGQATNIISTNPIAEKILLGDYDPQDYYANAAAAFPATIVNHLLNEMSTDSLKQYILKLASFQNRNSGSDTLSNTRGIGASRRWVYQKFQDISTENAGRLIPSYLEFEQSICTVTSHKNIFAVLPGIDTTDKSIVLIEGHIDSRCEGLCNRNCDAEGVEDNASGTALTIELARVMSQMNFRRTIVFLITTAEEQGLFGAKAFAEYAVQKGIKIRAVQNNDVIGGIICGATSSEPGCPGLNDIDSLQVRLFSNGGFNSPNKQYARFVKLEFEEEMKARMSTKMQVSIMSPEDRSGRGGDHIPFRQLGFPAIRFSSANEHGNADVSSPGYADRQHSTRDILGVDTDNDGVIDSFFVDFNYLARNAAINGNAAAMAASGPQTPSFTVDLNEEANVTVNIDSEIEYPAYRFAIRTLTNDWDTVYTMTDKYQSFGLQKGVTYFASTAAVDSNGTESLFSEETMVSTTGTNETFPERGVIFIQNTPNPFDEATLISVYVKGAVKYSSSTIRITDFSGSLVKSIPLDLKEGMNEILFNHGYNMSGILNCSLILDGVVVQNRTMVFAN